MALSTARATVILRDLTMRFDMQMRGMAGSPFYPMIATIVDSRRREEKYGWLGALPGMREWLGDRVFKELRGADYTLANKLWESSLVVERTDIEDDTMGMYDALIDELAMEATFHPDELIFNLINNGHANLAFDGQFFFDTDHVWGDSGSQSNDLTHAAATGTTPTVQEFKDSWSEATAALVSYRNDQGKLLNRPMLSRSSNYLAIVPPALEQVATEALTSKLISNSDNIILRKAPIESTAYLTSAATYFIFDLTPSGIKPFVFQAREPLRRQVKGLTDDIEFKEAKFMTEARYNAGYGAWWKAIRMEFT